MISRHVPPRWRRPVLLCGGIVALRLQTSLTLVVSYLIAIPGLRMIAALLLIGIACRLLREEVQGAADDCATLDLSSAILRIIMLELIFSLDNRVAVAGASRADPTRLGLGLLVSFPVVLAFSRAIIEMMDRFKWISSMGAGYVAVTAAGMFWQDLVVARPLTAALGLDLVGSAWLRPAFAVVVVSSCLTSPSWWPRSSIPKAEERSRRGKQGPGLSSTGPPSRPRGPLPMSGLAPGLESPGDSPQGP